ncbi:hypothetical protein HpDR94a_14830 [Helicobacter pylori]
MAWMLAQGQSSSAKRGGLAAVSSGLIFLKKKKKENHKKIHQVKESFGVQRIFPKENGT